ncbi:GNAT family N-acetyltransferase [Acetobacter oeni]|uniref:Acetyltransferase n=1 Tax=Acetobacter oeni TaxID=304077 RepID=A0A511XHN4_9PROT|nr:GNAT family N-acetyltransferase [Acetobacter oeni]MBB3881266.1 putative GNAT family acetyltransferase [Acetobacter oeni]NHO18141.1 GNAT family N-acetyltransferase [Acetobacter oeni]GBR08160.1 hypothetical protein AA21952_2533 [Acetobacter oeni LMG 21952]GEN62421.1 acetyltransferase [Acetobacter oeni]
MTERNDTPGHPLDRPVWFALNGCQAGLAIHAPGALRFDPAISPLAAAKNAASLTGLRNLACENEELWQLEKDPGPVPPGMSLVREAICVQMTAHTLTASTKSFHATPLGADDAEDMLALATLTAPGPFRKDTYRIGRFIGIRENGRLIAMAGERTKPDHFTEISGVCTHPAFRGRGYAGFLMREVASAILARGKTPFLHCYASNHGAIALYESLGFRTFQSVTARIIRRDTDPVPVPEEP